MNCTNCGAGISGNEKYCPKCGVAVLSRANNICKKCGAGLKAGENFCPNCGGKVIYAQERRSMPNVSVQKKNNSKNDVVLLVVLLTLVFVLFVGIMCLVFYGRGGGKGGNGGGGTGGNNGKTNLVVQQTPVPTSKPVYKSVYFARKENVTWFEARNNARDEGGQLVCIESEAEFDEVCAIADEADIKVFWVGAKINSDGLWSEAKWLSGEDITFKKWFPGEPSYISEEGEDELYLMVFKVDGQWYFNDAQNDVEKFYKGKMGYIIEIKEQI